MVYVINKNGNPLMPCSDAKAHHLLDDGKAKVIRRCPFTIKLLWDCEENVQPLRHGLDTGSDTIGSSVSNQKNEIFYISIIQVRNDITDKMTRRKMYRNNRRFRKTRYRKTRWLNRKNSRRKDRFSPTMTSKIDSHLKEIRFVRSLMPITEVIIETGNFDVHALKNPEVLKNPKLYQQGINYGFENTKAFVLDRDNHSCQNCKGKSGCKRLEVHHIIFRSQNGSDEENNLITLCKTCHDEVHEGKLKLKKLGKVKSQLKHATQMNGIRIQLLKRLAGKEFEGTKVQETFGYITKTHRQLLGLSKEHFNDAITIACLENIVNRNTKVIFKTNAILYKKCVSRGDYKKTRGSRSEQKLPTEKVCGFKKFDKVRYNGALYFIKARRNQQKLKSGKLTGGYFELMDICGKSFQLSPLPRFDKIERVNGRKSWMTIEKNNSIIGIVY